MRVLKDNSLKEYKIKCKNCRSVFLFTVDELCSTLDAKIVFCPCCKEKNYLQKKFGKWKRAWWD